VERLVRRGLLAVVAMAALSAGCFSPADGEDRAQGPGPMPQGPTPFVGTCDAGLLFFLVPHSATDDWLPPGFHSRDAQEFLSSPVAFGQAGVVSLMVECVAADGTRMESASTDIFVEPPFVPGLEAARFDFYELERYSDEAGFGGALRGSGWTHLPGDVSLDPASPLAPPDEAGIFATLTDEQGTVMAFSGPTGSPVPFGAGIIRFWHDTPRGLAYVQYDADLPARVGAGACQARAGTALAMLTSGALPGPERPLDLACPPGTPVVAGLLDLSVNATARFFPGVHAG